MTWVKWVRLAVNVLLFILDELAKMTVPLGRDTGLALPPHTVIEDLLLARLEQQGIDPKARIFGAD